MSLVKSPRMTEKRQAHLRSMRQLSKGPATEAGRERIRTANLRYGFYSQAEEDALRALGEDPADFLGVLEGLRGRVRAADDAEDAMVRCLARALWRIARADRIREGNTLRQAKHADDGREVRLHARMMRVKLAADSLRLLAELVSDPYYVATPDHLKRIQSFCNDGDLMEMAEIVLALFYELREPGSPGFGEPDAGMDPHEQQRKVLQRIKEIFGVADDPPPSPAPPPSAPTADAAAAPGGDASLAETSPAAAPHPSKLCYPRINDATWAAREPLRQLLENLLKREVEIFDGRHKALLKELVAGPSPYERAAEITPTSDHATLMQRFGDSNLRQALRLAELLAKIKGLAPGDE